MHDAAQAIKYLLANGVDVNEQASKRKFALYFAVAQVGMRVRRCAQNSTELGVTTKLGTDGGSELAVQWDGGGTDNNVKAGKRGNTDQQGIDLGSECARRTRPLRRCPGRAPAREKDRGCPRMVPQCGMDDGAYSRTVCAHRAQSQGERGGEGPETAGLVFSRTHGPAAYPKMAHLTLSDGILIIKFMWRVAHDWALVARNVGAMLLVRERGGREQLF